MSKEANQKVCFVISPIGIEGSADRVKSDQVLNHIIGPSVKQCGYDPIRADQISEPGIITSQIIQHILDSPLVVADLSGHNPNVFYEMALRHAIKKPIVQIIHATEKIPFDVAANRTVFFDHKDLDSVAKAKEEISKQIRHVEKNPLDVDTPISVTVELKSLRNSDNPLEKSYAEILAMLTEIRSEITDMRYGTRGGTIYGPAIQELLFNFDRLHRIIEHDEGKSLNAEQVDQLRDTVRRLERPVMRLCMESGISPYIFARRLRTSRKNE